MAGEIIVRTVSCIVEVTPTIGTAVYAAGDQIGSPFEIKGAVRETQRRAILQNVVVIDKEAQAAAVKIALFKNQPTMASADNAAVDITDANLDAAKFLGVVSVAAGDFQDFSSNQAATKTGIGLICEAVSTTESVWGLLISDGAPTYTSTNSIQVRLGFLQD